MYNAIKSQQILQPLNTGFGRANTSSHAPGSGMMRNRSLRSNQNLKRASIRGWQSLLSTQTGVSPYSSVSSIDGRASPAPSFATSAHEVCPHLDWLCNSLYMFSNRSCTDPRQIS